MNPSPAADEGEPARTLSFSFPVLLITVSLLTLVSCSEKKPETPKVPSAADSIALSKQKKKTEDSLSALNRSRKKIYLTFDDGPNKGTRNVLRVVRDEQVPASFFIVGIHTTDTRQQAETWEMLKADSAIELCNHSFSHAHNHYTAFYDDPAGVIADFNNSGERLRFTNKIARMPGRNAWRIDTIDHTDIVESRPAIDSLHQAGYAIMGWDIEWTFDHKTLAPDADTALLLRRIYNMLDAGKTKTPGHLVLLAHDQAFQQEEYVEELRYVIQQLKNNPDYQLLLAHQYPGIK